MSTTDFITRTQSWIESTVIGLNLCPFAKHPFQYNTIRFSESDTIETENLIMVLQQELSILQKRPSNEVETTLIILTKGWQDFDRYLSLIDVCDQWLVEAKLVGVIQIASFHPHYQFDGLDADDVRNYTNRSPYPMIHLLREDSISRAIDNYPDIASIPDINQEKLVSLGINYFKR